MVSEAKLFHPHMHVLSGDIIRQVPVEELRDAIPFKESRAKQLASELPTITRNLQGRMDQPILDLVIAGYKTEIEALRNEANTARIGLGLPERAYAPVVAVQENIWEKALHGVSDIMRKVGELFHHVPRTEMHTPRPMSAS